MKYKSPYRTAILLQEKRLNEKRQEIAVFQLEKKELEKKLQDYHQKENDFYQMLIDEMEFNARMLKNQIDLNGKNAILYMINMAEKKIQELSKEYMEIQSRIDNIKRMDKEKEKEFNKEKVRKESKEIESVMLVKRWKEKSEGGKYKE